jgi:phage-related protein
MHSRSFVPFPRIFHKTLIQVVESKQNRFGITIIDGDFLTVLPHGFSKKLLSYGPSISTRQKAESYSRPVDWVDSSEADIMDFQSQMKKRIDYWLEDWDYEITSNYLETIRTIEVGVESTDRRTSHVKNSAPRLIEVWSGKIDHAVEISKLIPKMVSRFRSV